MSEELRDANLGRLDKTVIGIAQTLAVSRASYQREFSIGRSVRQMIAKIVAIKHL